MYCVRVETAQYRPATVLTCCGTTGHSTFSPFATILFCPRDHDDAAVYHPAYVSSCTSPPMPQLRESCDLHLRSLPFPATFSTISYSDLVKNPPTYVPKK